MTVVRRDTPDPAHAGAGGPTPTSSRLQRVEAALAAETAGREKAERALHEAQAAVQALQTKMGHNDLAKNEALAASKRYADEIVGLREELAASAENLREIEARAREAEEELSALRGELAEERRARKLAERLLRETTEDKTLVAVHEDAPVLQPRADHGHDKVERLPARRGRPQTVQAAQPEDEAEPVKWWLLPAKPAAKRR